jgi:N-acetylmuramoyl-L-alanine amidase
MRDIKFIVVHCTTVEAIQQYWKEQLKWEKPGYHYIIQRDGEVVSLLDEKEIANGVRGRNHSSIHLSYIGGLDKNDVPADNRTPRQKSAMFDLLIDLTHRYPFARILGHRDFSGVIDACPCFDVKSWVNDYEPDLNIDLAA